MFTQTLLLAAALFSNSFHRGLDSNAEASVLAPVGGPPSIRLAGKSHGDIYKSDWSTVKTVDLHGCVPDARIVSLRICPRTCTGKDAGFTAKTPVLSKDLWAFVNALPVGTSFTVSVTVSDAKGRFWEVPDAKYVWRG